MHRSQNPDGPSRYSRLADSATSPSIPWWLVMLVIVGAALTATGAVIALFASRDLSVDGQEYALYFVTRNAAIALSLGAALALRSWKALAVLMTLTALIQCMDSITATTTGRYALIPVDLAYAALFLIGAARIHGVPFWRPHSAP